VSGGEETAAACSRLWLVPAQTPSRPIGAHVPVTGGLAAGLRYAPETGAETIQVFVSNPRGWAPSAGDARQDAALRDHVAGTGLQVSCTPRTWSTWDHLTR
jgi:hypothetical protein